MKIHLRAVLETAAVLGAKEQVMHIDDGMTVRGLLTMLLDEHGERLSALLLKSREPMELIGHMRIYVNGRSLEFLSGLDTGLHEDDDVMIMPQLSGG